MATLRATLADRGGLLGRRAAHRAIAAVRVPIEQLKGFACLVVGRLRQQIPRGAQPHHPVARKLYGRGEVGRLRGARSLIIYRESAIDRHGRLCASRNR